MITGTIVGEKESIVKLKLYNEKIRAELNTSITRAAIMVQGYVKAQKLSGQVLKRKTGVLSASISKEVTSSAAGVYGIVGTNVWYGRMWELGFDRKVGAGTRGGLGARGGKVLTGQSLETYLAKHPTGTKHYKKSFLVSAIIDKKQEIINEIENGMKRALSK